MDDSRGYDNPDSEAVVVGQEPCPDCGSKDNLKRWSDGHGHCFTPGCDRHENGTTSFSTGAGPEQEGLIHVEPCALPGRKISERTSRYFSYGVGKYKGMDVQVAQYRDSTGRIVAQKLRGPDKAFIWIGNPKAVDPPLFGAHLWGSGKKLVITEGEIDALSVAEQEGCSWPVVSLMGGASSAKKALTKALPYLENFEEIILMFDSDEAGQKAVEEAALVLSPGKAKIAKLQKKDANEMLVAGMGKELTRWKWNAQPYRPDCIKAGHELWDLVTEVRNDFSIPYPWDCWNTSTFGMRKGELTTLTAGTGIGKSSFCREIAFQLLNHGQGVGYVGLEESVRDSGRGIMGVACNLPLSMAHVDASKDVLRKAFDLTLGTKRLQLYDHFGSLDPGRLLGQLRYMVTGMACDYIIIDHLSIMVSGLGDASNTAFIDKTMTDLRTFCSQTGCGVILVSHLSRGKGTSHERGGLTELSQLRGSQAIGQLSNMVIGFERDQQDEVMKNVTLCRNLKNRYSGITGLMGYIEYIPKTGRLMEVTPERMAALNQLSDDAEAKRLKFTPQTHETY